MSGKTRQSKVVAIRPHRETISPVATRRGYIAGWSKEKGLLVDYAGSVVGPRMAESTVPLTLSDIEALIASRQPVLLTFAGDQPDRPIVTGIVQQLPSGSPPTDKAATRAVVDGKEVLLEGKDRVELRCGRASIVLTKAGKVLVHGTYISSNSTGVHRIRGGHVDLN